MRNPKLDLSALVRLQRRRRDAASQTATGAGGGNALSEITGFGSNPGALRMFAHVPADLPRGAPLVVALHGCTQNAAAYDQGCGWSAMADRLGFAVLLPEQQRANNSSLCFNWFEPGDTARGAGEALSIRQMIAQMLETHAIDPARVFVTGLSAGGAMTAVMLATYPETFAGGAIIAGLPFGAAGSVMEALGAMSRIAALPAATRGQAVRAASPHRGPWPRVSVWHGEADTTVGSDNAGESVKQWLNLHGLDGAKPVREPGGPGHTHLTWRGADGVARVESHSIAGMAHGVPLRPGQGEGLAGAAGAYMLDVGVSSTHRILGFWGIDTAGAAEGAPAPRAARGDAGPVPTPESARPAAPGPAQPAAPEVILARRPAAGSATQGPVTREPAPADASSGAFPGFPGGFPGTFPGGTSNPFGASFQNPFAGAAGEAAQGGAKAPPPGGPGDIIVRALRAAGLMGTGRE